MNDDSDFPDPRGEPKAAAFTGDEIPTTWRACLAAVRRHAPDAVLAGGALRDLAAGVPHADLDVFVRAEKLRDVIELAHAIDYREPDMRKRVCPGDWFAADCNLDREEYRRAFGRSLVGVGELVGPGRERVQIIGLDTFGDGLISSLLTEFDFAACRFAFDGAEIHVGHGALEDIAARRFTLTRAPNGRELLRSIRRYERWAADRFRGWSLEIAPRLFAGNHDVPLVSRADFDLDDDELGFGEECAGDAPALPPRDDESPAYRAGHVRGAA